MIFLRWMIPTFESEFDTINGLKAELMKGRLKIKVKGNLDESWKEWFEGMEITNEGEFTILSGEKKDDAYVHGILNKIRDLNLELISVNAFNKE